MKMMLRIDERLPTSPLESEVVLHVRLHARRAVRRKTSEAAAALALLFGFGEEDEAWAAAVNSADPMHAGAALAQRLRGSSEAVVSLGHDASHLEHCRRWLATRKAQDKVFAEIEASDLATLLELSKARDLAVAKGLDARGTERYLPILIQGPTGTGKELLADAIHRLWQVSAKKTKAPFEVVHVGGMSADMINDELFGHVKGGFTGATSDRVGRLEAADGGTLLIDEVGDLPAEAQVRLLRFLQTQEVSRIGENKVRALRVRVIAATWHDLDKAVSEGRFREDLLHRLRVGAGIRLPPLAVRDGFFDDLLPAMLKKRGHTATPLNTRSVRDALARYEWPGNLRELAGVLDEVVALADGETIRLEHLPAHLQRRYLELPLHERAIGFLLDEVDGRGLPDEHVSWRIEQISASLERDALPAANEQLATIDQFLALLDDNTEGHRRNVEDVKELIRLDQQHRLAVEAHRFWQSVLALEAPASVKKLVLAASDRAKEEQAALHRKISAGDRQASIDANPWLRLFKEVHELPLLRGANTGELAKAFLAIFNIVKLFAPAAIEEIRSDATAGGFDKIREKVVGFFRDDDGTVVDAPTRPRAAKMTPDEWRELAAKHRTQRAAVDATGFDPTTIAKYFKQHGIKNPWAADPEPAEAAPE
ncbi:MAG: sigma-54-dependent Fis family transcriptional regulator [Archangiaceae bacterium]|nr:sigma-54-dependent Fis family transcriptional regulator [Archangiaceae bacterium]